MAWCGVPPGLSSLNHVRVGGALQVYCWLVDRLGGGWTLGIVNAYRWCHPNQGNSPTGNVDRNVLGTVKLFVGISLTTLWTRHSSTHALYLLQFC